MKKLLVLVGLAVFAAGVQGAYLNWQVNNDVGGSTGLGSLEFQDYDRADLIKIDGAGNRTLVESQTVVNDEGHVFSYSETGVSSSAIVDGYSYYIELVSTAAGNSVRGESQKQTYAQLVAGGHISETLEDVPAMTVWHGGVYGVPEPTSAVLMLLGLATLGLRRKQRTRA